MLKEASTTGQWIETSAQTSDLSMIAIRIRDEALEKARAKMKPALHLRLPEELWQQRNFLEYLKFEIAAGIALEIGVNDAHVQRVHYFDPYQNPDAETEAELPFDPTINLLVEVGSNSPALKAYIEVLDNALTNAMRDLPDSPLRVGESLTNVIFITEDDIQNRRGYVAVIGSIYTPHRKIWER